MGMFDGLFGDSPPGVKTKWTQGWRDNMERLAGEGGDVFNEFMAFRQDMENYSVNLMQNVVSQQMDVFNQQFQNSTELFNLAKQDRAYYEEFYKPIEEKMRSDAQNWDSPEQIKRAMGGAQASVASAFQADKRNRQAQLEGYGIDPSETRAQALDRGVGIAQASAQASEANIAARAREQQGVAMRTGVANFGANIANRGLQTAGTAANVAQSASGIGHQTMTGANQTTAQNNAGYMQGANQLGALSNQYGNINNAYMQQYGAQLNQHNSTVDPAQTLWGIGSGVAGGIAGSGGFNSFFGSSEGGAVPTPEEAGVAPVRATVNDPRGTDRMPAALTPGEFVIPEETVRWKGEEYFHKEVAKAKEKAAEAKGQPAGAIPQQGQAA